MQSVVFHDRNIRQFNSAPRLHCRTIAHQLQPVAQTRYLAREIQFQQNGCRIIVQDHPALDVARPPHRSDDMHRNNAALLCGRDRAQLLQGLYRGPCGILRPGCSYAGESQPPEYHPQPHQPFQGIRIESKGAWMDWDFFHNHWHVHILHSQEPGRGYYHSPTQRQRNPAVAQFLTLWV